jgi:PAT family acetyl-CoA transporter-like MFS transporter 1
MIFLIVTAWLAFVKKEAAVSEDDPDMDVRKVYKVMWSIVRLKSEFHR